MSRSPERVVDVGAGDLPSARGRPAGQRRERPASQDRSNGAGVPSADSHLQGDTAPAKAEDEQTVSVAEAARLLGRDRTRVYALLRSGDLVAVSPVDGDGAGPVRIARSSLERWLRAGGDAGRPLSPRNAWALIGLASGDQPFPNARLGCLSTPKSCPGPARGWRGRT